MSIRPPIAPKMENDVFSIHLSEIAGAELAGKRGAIASAVPDQLSISDPHRNYFVPLHAVINSQLLQVAEPDSWRYLLIDHNQGVGEVEVSSAANERGEDVVKDFVALHHGPSAQNTIEALHFAEASDVLHGREYELRFLKVPALYFFAVWLHAEDDDLVIPLEDGPGHIRKQRFYVEADLIEELQPLAVEVDRAANTYAEPQS